MDENGDTQNDHELKTVLRGAMILGVAGLLLLLILKPTVTTTIKSSVHPVGRDRTNELDKGAVLYKKEHMLYPGQRHLGLLVSEGGKYTGSEILAMAVYGMELTPEGPRGELRSGLLPFKAEYITWNYPGHPYTLNDGLRGKKGMAICYYIARPGKEGLDHFVEADNAVYTDRAKGGDFRAFLEQRCGGRLPEFLLVAPGPDRMYFTTDDVTNFGR